MGSRWLGNRDPRTVARTPINSRGFLSVAEADRAALSVSGMNKLKTRAETDIKMKFTMMEKVKAKDIDSLQTVYNLTIRVEELIQTLGVVGMLGVILY